MTDDNQTDPIDQQDADGVEPSVESGAGYGDHAADVDEELDDDVPDTEDTLDEDEAGGDPATDMEDATTR